MKQSVFKVVSNRRLAADVIELRLAGDASAFTAPGQFAEISVPGLYLRRPISVCDWATDSLVLLVKEVGAGTRSMGALPSGAVLDVITGLGNGFDPLPAVHGATDVSAVLVGGGIGIAPLYALARVILEARASAGLRTELPVVLGFRSAADAFYIDAFAKLGCKVHVATEDGSLGVKGFVTDALSSLPGRCHVYACGPMPMLRALARHPQVEDGQFSLEARMGCGFGACMGCTIATAGGPKRICRDGPVFSKGEIQW